jgi:PAS domain S-box-containing protein
VAQLPIELILLRQLAGGLAVPIFVVDAAGDLLFINEAAERLLGLRFDEIGEMTFGEWTTAFTPRGDQGRPLESAELPLAIAIRERRPAHGPLQIVGQDGVARAIEVTALPLEGAHGQLLGGVAMFWEPHG